MDPSTQLHHPDHPRLPIGQFTEQKCHDKVKIHSFGYFLSLDGHMDTTRIPCSPEVFSLSLRSHSDFGVYRLVVAVTENKRVPFNIKCWTWRRTMWIEWKIFRANDDDGAFVWIRFGWQKCNDRRVECKWLFGSFFLLLHIRFFLLWNFEIKLDRIWFGIRCYPVAASLTNLLLFRRSEQLEL